jgi:zinc protease
MSGQPSRHLPRLPSGLGRAAVTTLAILFAILRPAAAVEIQRVISPGGIEAWLIEDHAVPVVSLSFGFTGGTALDPAGREGVATLASGLLDEGAGDLDATAFQQQLSELGVDFGIDASADRFTGGIRVLTEHLDRATDLLALALTSPRFDAEPLERIRRQLLIAIENETRDPGTAASRLLERKLLGEHPYARSNYGTRTSMLALTGADLRRFVTGNLARDRLFVAAAGDVTPERLAGLLDRAFGALPETGVPGGLAEAAVTSKGSVLLLERDIAQAVVRFAQPGIKRDDPDFFAAYLMNYILGGGGFSSRLMEEIREKRGLTYGIGTQLITLDHAGIIEGSFETANGDVVAALDLMRAEWQRMAAQGPDQTELDAAKAYLLGYYPRNLTTTSGAAGTLLEIEMSALGIDYMERRRTEISAVTLADVKRVAARLLDPAALTIVVAGQPAGLAVTPETGP